MPLLCKQRALYVKACIIANGVMDSQGDTLYSEDIKKIFTSFNNQDNFEIYHNDLPVPEVSLLENYICSADETIGTSIVPAGSWMAVIRVDNPEIQEGLLNSEFKGVSLSNRIADKCKANLHGTIRYQDVADGECVIPRFISFVKGGANGYGLHVMDYEAYIKKSKDIEINERSKNKMAFDLLGGLKKLVQQAEADSEPIIIKEDSEKKEDEKEEPVVEEPTTKDESSDDEPKLKKGDKEDESEDGEKEKEDEEEEDPSIEKDDETEPESDDEFEAKVTAIVKKVLAELEAEDNPTDEGDEEEPASEDEDKPKIVKSRKVIDDTPDKTIQNTNYYELSGRDPITGKKIRN